MQRLWYIPRVFFIDVKASGLSCKTYFPYFVLLHKIEITEEQVPVWYPVVQFILLKKKWFIYRLIHEYYAKKFEVGFSGEGQFKKNVLNLEVKLFKSNEPTIRCYTFLRTKPSLLQKF